MAIYKFITDEDLDLGLQRYYRDTITVGTEKKHIMVKCEAAASQMIRNKVNNKYDLTLLFPAIAEWNKDAAYVTDTYCYKLGKIYKALQDGANKLPADNANYWVEEDPRDQLLVKYAATITAYFMLETVSPRKLTEDIANEFAAIMDWLDEVMKGNESPDWPLLASGGSNDIPWGSNDKLEHEY